MIAYVVVEGPFDAQLLKRVLPKDLLSNVEIVSAGGVSAAKSLARSLIVRRQVPVAVVVDADSVAPELVQERLKNIEEIVKSVSVDTPIRVILAVPEMETVFFWDNSLLPRLLDCELSQDIISRAAFQPRLVLEQLLSQSTKRYSRIQILNQLTNEELDILRKAPVIQELIRFLQSVQVESSMKS